MQVVLKHPLAIVKIKDLSKDKKQIIIEPFDSRGCTGIRSYETSYPEELIKQILYIKGPFSLCDEIMRDEDPLYTQVCLENDLLGYIANENFAGKRLLDFGCGCGASTMILSRMFPETQIVGIDLSNPSISIAELRAKHYRVKNTRFLCSTTGDKLPNNIGEYDYIVLSAVYEHLLPEERKSILHQLWSILKPDGVLFINQTPYRYFPFEGHTTRIPLINYMPDKLAHSISCRFSRRISRKDNWETLLRRGIRGGSVREIMRILQAEVNNEKPALLRPNRLGFNDRIDLWYAGYAVSIANKYPQVKPIQKIMKYIFKAIFFISGIEILPALSLAIRKQKIPS